MSNKIDFSNEEIQDIIFLYTEKKWSMKAIGEKYSCSPKPIKRILTENNIKIKRPSHMPGEILGIYNHKLIKVFQKDGRTYGEFECGWCHNPETHFINKIDFILDKKHPKISCGCQDERIRRERTNQTTIKYQAGDRLGPENILLIERTGIVNKKHNGKFKCPYCGKIFETRISYVSRGDTKSCGCLHKKTARKNGQKEAVNLKGKRSGKLTALEPTEKRKNNQVVWKCLCDCGKITYVRADDIRRQKTLSCGCIKCSKGEEKIKTILIQNNINFFTQWNDNKKCKNLITKAYLFFDFYLPDYNCCIEYDGEQHFRPIEHFGGKEKYMQCKQNDNIKNQYCKDNNIKLIRIPYYDYDKITEEYIKSRLKEGVIKL